MTTVNNNNVVVLTEEFKDEIKDFDFNSKWYKKYLNYCEEKKHDSLPETENSQLKFDNLKFEIENFEINFEKPEEMSDDFNGYLYKKYFNFLGEKHDSFYEREDFETKFEKISDEYPKWNLFTSNNIGSNNQTQKLKKNIKKRENIKRNKKINLFIINRINNDYDNYEIIIIQDIKYFMENKMDIMIEKISDVNIYFY